MEKFNFEESKFIVFLLFFDELKQEDLIFNENIILRKISDVEKKYFMDNYSKGISPDVLTHCLDIKFNNKDIIDEAKKIHNRIHKGYHKKSNEEYNKNTNNEKGTWLDKKINPYIERPLDDVWPLLDNKEINHYIYRVIHTRINNFENSINLVVNIPVHIYAVGECNGSNLVKFNEYGEKYASTFEHEAVIKSNHIESINKIFEKVKSIEMWDDNNDWWTIPFEFLERHAEFDSEVEGLLNLTIALESLLSGKDEPGEIGYRLKLRASLYLYEIRNINPIFVQNLIREIYGVRSKIVHGGSRVTQVYSIVDKNKNKKGRVGISLGSLIVIFYDLIRIMLYDVILYHSEEPKEEFIKYIDTIWKNNGEGIVPYDIDEIKNYWDLL